MNPYSRFILLLFCLPAITQSFMHGPANAMLQGIYAKYLGVPLVALGTAILIARVFDAITDPLIGYLSDKTQERYGTRKPWLAAGAFVSVIAVWFLYRPPENVSATYFTIWFILAYLGWTMVEIPYRSWSMGLSSDYEQRTRIVTWVAMGTVVGGIAFFTVPFALLSLGITDSTEMSPVTLAATAVVVAVTLPLAVVAVYLKVPDAPNADIAAHGSTSSPQGDSLKSVLASLIKNRPFVYLTALFLFMGITSGMGGGLLFLYIDVYLGLGEQLASLLILATPIVLIATPVWGWVCTRLEKHRALAISMVMSGISALGFAFVPIGGEGALFLIPLLVLNFVSQAAGVVAFPALMGDVADYGKLHFGHDRTGVYFSVFTMVQKALGGLGVSLGLFIAAYFGFDAMSAEQTERGIFGMKLTMAYIPALATAVAIPLMLRFPINRARHKEIVDAISAREMANNTP